MYLFQFQESRQRSQTMFRDREKPARSAQTWEEIAAHLGPWPREGTARGMRLQFAGSSALASPGKVDVKGEELPNVDRLNRTFQISATAYFIF